MVEQQTCGRGLAEHSMLPTQMAELTEALADRLSVHLHANAPRALVEDEEAFAARRREIAGDLGIR
jgi:hypothetical protein